ncbi:hypothetical protein HK100_006567, partial [Physocladia obscura]
GNGYAVQEKEKGAIGFGSAGFLDGVDEVRRLVDALVKKRIPELETLHGRIVATTQASEAAALGRQAASDTARIAADLQAARRQARDLNALAAKGNPVERTSQRAQVAAVAKAILRAADAFEAALKSFKARQRVRLERELRIARPNASNQDILRALDDADANAANPFAQQMLVSSRTDQSRRALQQVQDRNQDLLNIERSMQELLDLFQEMQDLISMQQDLINNVESNVENTVEYLESGSKELTKAIQYKKSSRKKQIWIVAIVIVVLIIAGIAVYIERVFTIVDERGDCIHSMAYIASKFVRLPAERNK